MLLVGTLAFTIQGFASHRSVHSDRPHNVRAQTHVHCHQHCYRHCHKHTNKCDKTYKCHSDQSVISEDQQRALQRLRDKK